jgi:calcineurin-like phosphoesterase family protein
MAILYCGDTHFSHNNILKYCNRPFQSIEEHDEILIQNWNKVVHNNDIVYFLGDFAWKTPDIFLKKLNGSIVLIKGNHDYKFKYRLGDKIINIYELHSASIEGANIVMCHYCLRVWDKSHWNSFHLYGHSHNRLPPIGKSLDVGVDGHYYTPWKHDEIIEYMKTRPNNENYIGDR